MSMPQISKISKAVSTNKTVLYETLTTKIYSLLMQQYCRKNTLQPVCSRMLRWLHAVTLYVLGG